MTTAMRTSMRAAMRTRSATAILRPFIQPLRRRRIDAVLRERTAHVTVVLESLIDPHNVGAVLRSCDAFGIQHVFLVGPTTGIAASRAVSQGCERWLTLHRIATTGEALAELKARGFDIAVAVKRRGALPARRIPLARRTALWFGNEHDGASALASRGATRAFWIPLVGMSQSLNVSVAAAVTLALVASRAPRGLPKGEATALREAWYRRDVRGADAILRRFGGSPRERGAGADEGDERGGDG